PPIASRSRSSDSPAATNAASGTGARSCGAGRAATRSGDARSGFEVDAVSGFGFTAGADAGFVTGPRVGCARRTGATLTTGAGVATGALVAGAGVTACVTGGASGATACG